MIKGTNDNGSTRKVIYRIHIQISITKEFRLRLILNKGLHY